MPMNDNGSLRPFTAAEIKAMNIRTAGVRDFSHPFETREIDQSTMRRSYYVKWDSRFDFCDLCCGDEVRWRDPSSGVPTYKISRMLPDPVYGTHPDFYQIVATKIESIRGANGPGIDDADKQPAYPDARVDVLYSQVRYNLETDDQVAALGNNEALRYTYFDESDGDADLITLPGSAMRFWRNPTQPNAGAVPNGVPVPYGVSITRAKETFAYNWVRVPYECFAPDSPLYRRVYGSVEGDIAYQGCVNSQPFFNRPTGTVVFRGVKAALKLAQSARGKRWDLQYQFVFSPTGWTWLYYPDPGGTNSGYYMVSSTGFSYSDTLQDGVSIVPGSRDLNLLFQVN